MATPAVAPYVATYATYTPYITVEEYLADPTGVDTSQLIPGGSVEDNEAALAQKIMKASSEADRIAQKLLAATVDVQTGRYRLYDGKLRVPVPYAPLIQVDDVSVGASPGDLTPLPDLSCLEFEAKNVAAIPASVLPSRFGSRAAFGDVARRPYVQVTYVNGYAHTVTTASAAQGASSITVASPLGIVPGMPLTVYDAAQSEPVMVAADYELGSTSVSLAAPLAYAHSAGVAVSALPPWVKQAVIYLTTAMIKARGSEAVVMATITDQAEKIQPSTPGGVTEYNRAVAALTTLRRVR